MHSSPPGGTWPCPCSGVPGASLSRPGASALSPVFTQAAAGGTNHLPPLMDTRLPLTAARCFWERLLTSGCNLPPKVPSPSLAAPHKGRWQNTHCRDPRKGSREGVQPPPPGHRPLWQGPSWPRGEAVRLGPWCGCPAGVRAAALSSQPPGDLLWLWEQASQLQALAGSQPHFPSQASAHGFSRAGNGPLRSDST